MADTKTIKGVIGEISKTMTTQRAEKKGLYVQPENNICSIDCEICNGIGWIRRELPISDPNFGKLEPCPNADLYKVYGTRLGLAVEERSLEWTNIKDRENVEEAIEEVTYILSRGYGWVFLWGGYGLAKTLILKIAAAQSIRNKTRACYIRMAEIIDTMRTAFDRQDPNYEGQRLLNVWSEMPVLCIDEFDRIRETEYASERRFLLMDRRYENALRRQGITIMASNSDPDKMDGYLADRIADARNRVVHLRGRSARPMMPDADL